MNYYLRRFQEAYRSPLNFFVVIGLLLALAYSLFLNFSFTRGKVLSQQVLSIPTIAIKQSVLF